MFEIQQRETNPSFSREADGGGITDDTLLPWKRDCSHRLTALSPLDPNGRIPIRVRIVCTSSGNRGSFKLHSSRSEWRETDKVNAVMETFPKKWNNKNRVTSPFVLFFSLSLSSIARSSSFTIRVHQFEQYFFLTICYFSQNSPPRRIKLNRI